MDHLVVLEGIETGIEAVGKFLRRRENLAEERQALVALAEPEGIDDSRHISNLAGSHSPPHDGYHTQHHPHNERKGSHFF